jgi:hypothetical protein
MRSPVREDVVGLEAEALAAEGSVVVGLDAEGQVGVETEAAVIVEVTAEYRRRSSSS